MEMADIEKLEALARLVRYYILLMTTEVQSGHPTSSLSATDLMVDLFFNHFRFDLKDPANPANDRVIFSKGHASPLVYALYAAAGAISEKELLTYRQFGSELEGHPTPRFKYAEVSTGSLGQGLSIGVGMALGIRGLNPSRTPADADALAGRQGLTLNSPNVYVLMGDSETAEGSVWEAAELASFYKLNNLVAIVDVNRLGQSTETMLGWNLDVYRARFEAFGWEAFEVDGHDLKAIDEVFKKVSDGGDKPKVILAKTVKGEGVSFWEDKEGWHGKPLPKEEFDKAVKELGDVDKKLRGEIKQPSLKGKFSTSSNNKIKYSSRVSEKLPYKLGDEVATRKAYGEALAQLAQEDPRILALDGETSNSTFSDLVKEKTPDQFIEMFIAEQNMAGVALGLSKRGFVPFASTFAAFWTRAFDQIRMSAYSQGNVKFVGSHSGVSIGEDGASQMGLEDLALFKTVYGSTVFCPSDATSTAKLTAEAARTDGIFYIRTARPNVPVLYSEKEEFEVGGSKILRRSKEDKLTIVACGVVVHEVLKAYEVLEKEGVKVRVIDAYSIKPIDGKTILEATQEAGKIVITVEDHYFDGGLGDSVLNALSDFPAWVVKMAVTKMPMSGKPAEILAYEGIDSEAIVKKIKAVMGM
jgi:transketolase